MMKEKGTMSESGMPSESHAKKARHDRCKRLEIINGKMHTTAYEDRKSLSKNARFKGLEKESCSGSGKTVELTSEEGVETSSPLTRYGLMSVIGRRRVMEDAVMVKTGLVEGEFDFFAVYDGHGGAKVANACRERLHYILEKEIEAKKLHLVGGDDEKRDMEWGEVMAACFAKMDEEVLRKGGGGQEEAAAAEITEMTVGSTAVVVMVGKQELVVANCGDSRAVLSRGGMAMQLSHDHKADRPDEAQRVEAAGGRIINWNGCRVLGVLNTSRSIGDHYLRPYVISEPEITWSKRSELDDFFIVATDGLWDVISNDLACKIVKLCLDGRIRRKNSKETGTTEAATALAELAIAKGSTDNISVIVVDLKNTRFHLTHV